VRPARRRTLAGYELEHRLGEGSTSTVWRARQLSSMGRPVALKFVADRAAAQAEVEALAALDHPHVVRVFELVEDGDDVAIAMQLATGGSLDERLRRRGPMPADEVVDVVAKLAGALASAHRRGLLHRDVKPGNVLFTADGEPLLSDFGLSSAADDGRIRGTQAYLDPTVLAGRPPDVAADLYGLGAVAFEMLSGAPPAPGAGSGAAQPAGAPPGPGAGAALPADVPPVLAAVVDRLLAAAPEARFASAEEVVVALAADEVPAPIPPVEAVAADDPTVTRDFGPRPPAPVVAARRSRGSRRRVAVVAAGVVLLAVGLLLVMRPSSSAPGGAAEPAVARRCPPVPAAGPDVLVGDTDGDGCPDAVPRADNVLEHEGARYALGEAGDEPMLGDWNCDGVATPGVRRASDGRLHLFDRWAAGDQPLPAATVVAPGKPIPGCD
jgi:eukaryotic-like serine/threonine-protein kinase